MQRAVCEDIIKEKEWIKHTVVCEKCGYVIKTSLWNRVHKGAAVLCAKCLHENKFDYEPK